MLQLRHEAVRAGHGQRAAKTFLVLRRRGIGEADDLADRAVQELVPLRDVGKQPVPGWRERLRAPVSAAQQALSAVQSLSGLPPTGILDAPTWDALAALYNLWAVKFLSSPPIK